jgi:diphthamide synthase subunit DPH2
VIQEVAVHNVASCRALVTKWSRRLSEIKKTRKARKQGIIQSAHNNQAN